MTAHTCSRCGGEGSLYLIDPRDADRCGDCRGSGSIRDCEACGGAAEDGDSLCDECVYRGLTFGTCDCGARAVLSGRHKQCGACHRDADDCAREMAGELRADAMVMS